MNTGTREIVEMERLSEQEKASGKWIPVRRQYVQKQPISDADYARIMAADERRKRRAAKRLRTTEGSAAGDDVDRSRSTPDKAGTL